MTLNVLNYRYMLMRSGMHSRGLWPSLCFVTNPDLSAFLERCIVVLQQDGITASGLTRDFMVLTGPFSATGSPYTNIW